MTINKLIDSSNNILLEGKIQSGKTTKILAPIVNELINNDENLFILDSKEEYINAFYDKLANKKYNILIYNLRNPKESDEFNPLYYPYKLYKKGEQDKASIYVDRICKNLFYQENKESDPFWVNSASDLVAGLILGLYENAKESEINFESIYNSLNELYYQEGTNDYIKDYFNIFGKNSTLYKFASTTILAPTDTRMTIVSVARSILKPFVQGNNLSKLLSSQTSITDNLSKSKNAIIFIGMDEVKDLNPLVSIFIDQLYMILINSKNNTRFNFILDNFDSIKIINDFNNILSSSNSRNVKFYIASRNIEYLKEKYTNYIENTLDIYNINDFDSIEYILTKSSNIKYPVLKNYKFDIFDISTFLEHYYDSKIELNYDEKKLKELMDEIDKKIEILEKEELEDSYKNDNE